MPRAFDALKPAGAQVSVESPDAVRRSRALPKAALIPALLLVALVPLYWLAIGAAHPGLIHDDGVYIVTAKALAEGKGYRIISLPGEIMQTKYPMLMPALLSFLWRLYPEFPENMILLKAAPIFWMVVWLALIYLFARKYGRAAPAIALWIVFFTAVNQWSLFTTATIMSESMFSALALASLTLLAANDRHSSTAAVAGAALLASAAYHTRTAALPLIAAGVLAPALRRRYRQAALFGAITAAFILSWMAWQRSGPQFHTTIESYYTGQNYAAVTLPGAHLSFGQALHVAIKNVYFLERYPLNSVLCFPWPAGTPYLLVFAAALPLWFFILRGFFTAPRWLFPAQVFVALYLGMLVMYVWEPDRLLLPVLPLLLLFAFLGLPERLPARALAAAAVMPLVFAALLAQNTVSHQVAALADPPWIPKDRRAGPAVEWPALHRVHEWVKQHAAPGAVLLANYDPALYLYTGHQAIRPYAVDGPRLFYGVQADIARKIQEFSYVMDRYRPQYFLETGHDDVEEPDYHTILTALISEGRLKLVKEFAPRYRAFEVMPSGVQPARLANQAPESTQ